MMMICRPTAWPAEDRHRGAGGRPPLDRRAPSAGRSGRCSLGAQPRRCLGISRPPPECGTGSGVPAPFPFAPGGRPGGGSPPCSAWPVRPPREESPAVLGRDQGLMGPEQADRGPPGRAGGAARPGRPPDRLPHLPGQPALRGPGRLHPPPHPGAGGARPLGRGLRRPALARARRGGRVHPGARASTSTATPTRSGCPTPGSSTDRAALIEFARHVVGRVRRAPRVLPADPHGAGRPAGRVRHRPRQPVPRLRDARASSRTVGRCSPRCTTRSPSTASWPSTTPPTPGSASRPGGGSGSCGCRCGWPAGCRRSSRCRSRRAATSRPSSGSARTRMSVVPVGVDHTVFEPHAPSVTPVAGPAHGDLVERRAAEGSGPAARGGGQAAHRARHRAGRDRPAPARAAGSTGPSTGWGWATPCAA